MQLYHRLNEEHPGWLDWEPETIRKIIEPDEKEFNKIMALQTALNSQSDDEGFHFTDWQVFEKIVLTLNGVVPNFIEVEEAEPREIEAAFRILKTIKDDVTFNNEVEKYIIASYKNNNFIYTPFLDIDLEYTESKMVEKLKRKWGSNREYTDNALLQNQLKRLHRVEEYAKEMVKNATGRGSTED